MVVPLRLGFSGTPSDLLPEELGPCHYERGDDARMLQVGGGGVPWGGGAGPFLRPRAPEAPVGGGRGGRGGRGKPSRANEAAGWDRAAG